MPASQHATQAILASMLTRCTQQILLRTPTGSAPHPGTYAPGDTLSREVHGWRAVRAVRLRAWNCTCSSVTWNRTCTGSHEQKACGCIPRSRSMGINLIIIIRIPKNCHKQETQDDGCSREATIRRISVFLCKNRERFQTKKCKRIPSSSKLGHHTRFP